MTAMLTPEQELDECRLDVRAFHREAIRYTVEVLEDRPLIDAPHHAPLCRALDRVVLGECTRLVISVPPGTGKTLMAVWALMARGFLVNPAARFLHTSYSADLALSNSAKVRELLMSNVFGALGAPSIKDTSRAKGLWETEAGGTVRAVQAGGGITGFRAGHMAEGFTGAAIIDDPQKPDDARSRRKLADTNRRYNTTIASRLAHEGVPIVVIQQRLATFPGTPDDPAESGDMTEFLLRGGSGETWDHLMLPAEIDNALPYPAVWTHGRPIDHGLLDGPLWPYKLNRAALERLERANAYVYAAQYQQRPKMRTGEPMIAGEWFGRYRARPEVQSIELFADTANKTRTSSDYSVILVGGKGADGKLYLLDLVRGKWTAPELLRRARDVWAMWRAKGAQRFNVEDAQSGTGLIQSLAEEIGQSVKGIPRSVDKFTRVNGVTERISSGRVMLPASAPWVAPFIAECEEFTDDDSHAHDDQVDTLVDAIERFLPATPTYDPAALI